MKSNLFEIKPKGNKLIAKPTHWLTSSNEMICEIVACGPLVDKEIIKVGDYILKEINAGHNFAYKGEPFVLLDDKDKAFVLEDLDSLLADPRYADGNILTLGDKNEKQCD